jgi:DNA repair protein RecN (Recombination protein N)
MLRSLSIRNYALLVDVEVEFGPDLNIMTGETGAGKSIILGALGTILGDRVDTSMVRTGASKAVIEGVFSIGERMEIRQLLIDNDLGDEYELILRREITDAGRSRAFVNDMPVQLALMQEIGDRLVDLHGQHEHQSLLKVRHHLDFLDEFGEHADEREKVADTFLKLKSVKKHLEAQKASRLQSEEKKNLLRFQLQEIEKVNPQPGEEEALISEEKLILNSERLFNISSRLYGELYDDENSAFELLSRVHAGLQELAAIDGSLGEFIGECESARVIVEELSKHFRAYASRLDFRPERAEQVQNRIAQLSGLKKRFGRNGDEILGWKEQLSKQIEELETVEHSISGLEEQVAHLSAAFSSACQLLSDKRRKAAIRLEQEVPAILEQLGMGRSRFKVDLQYQSDPAGDISLGEQRYSGDERGMDVAEFYIATNEGEDLKPLSKVVSGGEISRIMLTLKSILAKEGQIPVMVFDEIDAGVSGRVAVAVGRKLKGLADYHQVICITHLPQIASMGHFHWFVEKQQEGGRTETRIRRLGEDERIYEIAKLLAGEQISESHLSSAKELLKEAVAA